MDAAPTNVVVVLTRAPSSGGKTRLFAALGRPVDPALLEALLLDTLDGVRESGARVLLAVTPPEALAAVCALADLPGIPQSDGNIGVRMRRAMEDAFASGATRVALVGSDLPGLGASHITAAFAALDADPNAVVLGPTRDGGYYLIAGSTVPPLFDGIRWSSIHTLSDTREAAIRHGLSIALLDPLDDVDGIDDLQRLDSTSPRSLAWVEANGIARIRGNDT